MIDPGVLEPSCIHAPDFQAVYLRSYPVVFAFAYRRTRDPLLAEEITAQTFLQALQAFHRYEDRGLPISAWLCRIARNLLAEQARRAAPLVVVADSTLIEAIPDPENGQVRWEDAAWAADQLAPLKADHRRVLLLRFWGDHTLAEVAAEMERSVGATRALLHRALGALRTRMREESSRHHVV